MNDFYEGRMIPLKIADMAIINCNKEIEKLQIENARLQAEVERLRNLGIKLESMIDPLKAEVERLDNNCDYLDRKLDEEIDKSAMLCGQVERLRKAGNAMASEWVAREGLYHANEDFIANWNAAKEGKPSA